jgi:hypothetical protein
VKDDESIVKVWLVSEGVPPPDCTGTGSGAGTGTGVRTTFEVFDSSESPALLHAMRVNVYSVPGAKPVSSIVPGLVTE